MHKSTLVSSAGRILIVDDDEGIRELLKYACAAADYAVSLVGRLSSDWMKSRMMWSCWTSCFPI